MKPIISPKLQAVGRSRTNSTISNIWKIARGCVTCSWVPTKCGASAPSRPTIGRQERRCPFRRYDARNQEDREEFRSVLWALQRQLPLETEPLLAQQHWEMLYARSLGCIGLLKLHLIRALALALTERAQTITETHLRVTAPSEDRVKEMLRAALTGEKDLTEPDGADERLLELLGLREKATAVSITPGSTVKGPPPPGPNTVN